MADSNSAGLQQSCYPQSAREPTNSQYLLKGVYISHQITQLLTGQSQLSHHFFKIKKIQSPVCDCGTEEESIEHFLFTCCLFTGLSTPTSNSSNVISHLESTSEVHQGISATRSQKSRVKPILCLQFYLRQKLETDNGELKETINNLEKEIEEIKNMEKEKQVQQATNNINESNNKEEDSTLNDNEVSEDESNVTLENYELTPFTIEKMENAYPPSFTNAPCWWTPSLPKVL
ncbi:hypothetical protein OUZ56_005295 [Daphnia magna]|uniref:Reverse transcriptase zinc-binding domain-containing protein n=1 Tax=Daphnia magna TaxID=35525 RepID=A0ABQ9YSL9_9CRUS|nr:hypothetical protein OUZ56_005295 [Daphnia magna]